VHSTAYCQAIENAAEIETPPRARFIRTIILELERIQSHLLWFGIAGHILGFDTVLMQAWRIREPVMWLSERITGNRKTFGMNIVGGVRRDIPESIHDEIREVLDGVEQETKALIDAIQGDTPLMLRIEGAGYVSTEVAIKHSLLGPTARGSGVAIDIRKDHPYAAYIEIDTPVVVETGCDNLARVLVRLKETLVSIEIVREALARMPKGPIQAKIDKPIPAGKVGVSSVEAPRGEVHHFVITGEDSRPYRWKARAPTFQNLQGVPPMILEETVADVPIDIGSFDPCFSCTERVEVVDVETREVRVYTKKEIEQLCREKTRHMRLK